MRFREGAGALVCYRLDGSGPVEAEGRAIGQWIGSGVVRVLDSVTHMASFTSAGVLVAVMTDPD